jgi:hypothetical protein
MPETQDNTNNPWEALFKLLESARKLGFGYCIGAGFSGLAILAFSIYFPKLIDLYTYLPPATLLGGLLGLGLRKFIGNLMDYLISPIIQNLKLHNNLIQIDFHVKLKIFQLIQQRQ